MNHAFAAVTAHVRANGNGEKYTFGADKQRCDPVVQVTLRPDGADLTPGQAGQRVLYPCAAVLSIGRVVA